MANAKSHCALTYNGILIDAEIAGYMTVNVEGRQLIAPKIKTIEIPGRNGDVVLSQQYPARDLVVHFLLKERNNFLFLEKIKKLTELLQSNSDVPLSFYDEVGHRFGRLIDIEDPPYDSNFGMGKFTIHCADPFLYRDLKTTDSVIERLKYRKYPVKIDSITATIPSTTKVVIKNETRGTNIIFNGQFNAGDKLVVTNESITVNGQNRMMWLDFVESEYQQFHIYSEDRITITPTSPLNIKYWERVL